MQISSLNQEQLLTASVHLATGAASALLVQDYLPAKYDWNYGVGKRYMCGFLAGILSHVFFDAFPHAEYSLHGQALMAVLGLECLLVMAILPFRRVSVMGQLLVWGMIGGALPDVLYFAGSCFGIEWLQQAHFLLHVLHGRLLFVFVTHPMQIAIVVAAAIYVRLKSA